MRTDRRRHQTRPGSPPQPPERFFSSQQVVLGQNSPPAPEEPRPVRPRKMAHDRTALVAKSKPRGPCAKGPIHVLRHSGAKAADSIEDLSPHPHVAVAGVPLDEDVSLEIKPE